jgi:DNA-binding NarL/FixJ family response regulator
MQCLLVDDSEEFLASAARLLESQGIDVVGRARTRDEALELAATLGPDLALVDIELGADDGIELAYVLKERWPSLQLILISAYQREELGDLISDGRSLKFLPKSALGADAIAGLLA